MGEVARPLLNRRAAARFAGIQALYQIELGEASPATVVEEFVRHRLGAILEPLGLELAEPEVDKAFFRRLVLGVCAEQPALDDAIAATLSAGWTMARLGFPVRACLRAAAYELARCPDIPVPVVINEYIELAKMFLAESDPAFVNAALDRLAPKLRPVEVAP